MDTPARFRRRPGTVMALQFHESMEGFRAAVDFCGAALIRIGPAGGVAIRTLEGDMTVGDGDWLVCGVKGEFYPVKPDVFKIIYEPA